MFNPAVAKTEQARIIGQIQSIYKDSKSLLTPTINQVEFEKAITEDGTKFFFDDVIKGFVDKALQDAEKETDEVKKSELLLSSASQVASLEKVNVVFDNMQKSIYVDVIDLNHKTYKDNAINRKLERVGQPVK